MPETFQDGVQYGRHLWNWLINVVSLKRYCISLVFEVNKYFGTIKKGSYYRSLPMITTTYPQPPQQPPHTPTHTPHIHPTPPVTINILKDLQRRRCSPSGTSRSLHRRPRQCSVVSGEVPQILPEPNKVCQKRRGPALKFLVPSATWSAI